MSRRNQQSVEELKKTSWGRHALKLEQEAKLKRRITRRKTRMTKGKPGWEFSGKIEAEQMLYIIASEQGFKIGISNDPLARLRALQTGSPIPVYLYRVWKPHHAASLEKRAHEAGRHWRMHGEWFRLTGLESMTNFIQKRCKHEPVFAFEPAE